MSPDGLRRRTVLRAGAMTLGAAGVAGTAAGQDGGEVRPEFGDWLADVDGGYRDARGQDEVRVQVGAQGNGGAFAFQPAGLWIDPGTTVVWEWSGEGGQHNVNAEAGADFESELVAEAGFTFEQTLEEGGIVEYQCDPHASLGMKGSVAVGDDVPTAQVGGGGDGGASFTWPVEGAERAMLLVLFGVLGLAGLSVAGAEGYAGWRRRERAATAESEVAESERDESAAPEPSFTEEAPVTEPVRELHHDEYDPVGTATLIVGYLVVVVLMWVFMYFVEFLGNGPTVVG